MKNGAIYSGLLHLAMFAVIAVGLPELRDPTPLISQPVPVEIVTISPKSNPPKGRERAVKKPPKPEPKKPQARAAEPPKVEPAPKKDPPKPPKKEVAVVLLRPDHAGHGHHQQRGLQEGGADHGDARRRRVGEAKAAA